ncbi:MAG: tetratricopeptide repeat protein [Gemmatimonadetes bacterium]|nr:tetratricopeptide repeat protein [Gemmatimonadota bacterium]
MRRALLLGLALAAPLPGCAQERGTSSLEDAREAFQTGDYETARRIYESLAGAGPDGPRAARGWALTLAATGEYEAGLGALAEAETAGVPVGELDRVRGALLHRLGRWDEAEARLRAAGEGGATDAALARLALGRLLFESGRRDEALDLFDGFIDLYNGSARLDSEHLSAVGTALTYLGARDPGLFHDAVRAFEEAIRADPGDPDAKIGLGSLFLEKYDSPGAGQLIDEALTRNPRHAEGLLAKAVRARFDGSSEAIRLAEASLEQNPALVEAHALLARLYLELEDPDRAEASARRALETDPGSLVGWTELAAIAHFRGDDEAFDEALAAVLGRDPTHAALFEALAEVAYRTHRYGDAVMFAERAVELDPTRWSGMATLGLNQLRLGRIDQGRGTLEAAFTGDPFNVWVKNTLDMLDELATFERTDSERFRFSMHPDEAEILSVYAPALAEEAFTAMARRYRFEPPTPITVEMYDRHADFSVRTVGLAGIGALGVSFGSVLAMDSPAARAGGEFNWGFTLWHEISHAFTLGYTEHRVPRWLSEGLAVLDERHARPGWGSDVDPGFLIAFREERLPSLERFNYGFVRPAYPGQVQHSYFMASLLCEMIEETRGFDAILALLDAYRDGSGTADAVRGALGVDLGDLDEELRAYIGERYAAVLPALGDPDAEGPPVPGTFPGLMVDGARAASEGRSDDAIEMFERAREMFPEYAGPDAPALLLARLYRDAGDAERAAIRYREYTALNENHFDARIELAELEEQLGNVEGFQAALEGAIWVDPYGPDLHARLAGSYEESGDWARGARERAALLALDPTDLAEAHYRLAFAQFRGGDRAAARRSVLAALEIAPSYDDALELLLEIRGGSEGTR